MTVSSLPCRLVRNEQEVSIAVKCLKRHLNINLKSLSHPEVIDLEGFIGLDQVLVIVLSPVRLKARPNAERG